MKRRKVVLTVGQQYQAALDKRASAERKLDRAIRRWQAARRLVAKLDRKLDALELSGAT